ncbi:homeotic protein knotted-1-like [Cicer arietinum]|uniref:Homeobox protein knotted-1-like 1 n=1 Tax=Cicer arietinum TaxID=3827 RepID=A0A1S2Z0C5_CICAR|nr:homeobox protein knotted-1-like 1 [Cicer arietinum]
MESKRNSFDDGDNKYKEHQQQEFEQEQEGGVHPEEENNEILKRRISSHPLYQFLVEAHLDCLKVADISNLEIELKKNQKQAMKKQNLDLFSQSELDLFMEAYCLALSKLKEAMEEPQQNSMAFINNMHSQLRELSKATTPSSSEQAASSSECTFRRNPTI